MPKDCGGSVGNGISPPSLSVPAEPVLYMRFREVCLWLGYLRGAVLSRAFDSGIKGPAMRHAVDHVPEGDRTQKQLAPCLEPSSDEASLALLRHRQRRTEMKARHDQFHRQMRFHLSKTSTLERATKLPVFSCFSHFDLDSLQSESRSAEMRPVRTVSNAFFFGVLLR